MTYFVASEHGLEYVGGVDWLRNEGCYEWHDTTVMYHRETDMFYWETASGCSCNTPLEDVESLADLEFGSFHEFTSHLTKLWEDSKLEGWHGEDTDGVLALEVTRVIEAAVRVREGK